MPQNIADYISRVLKHSGTEKASEALDIIVILRAQILLMEICLQVLSERQDEMTKTLADFKCYIDDISNDFLFTTGISYVPGKYNTSNLDEMHMFLKQYNLLELYNMMEEINLNQLIDMNDEEIKMLIHSEAQRKCVFDAITDFKSRYLKM